MFEFQHAGVSVSDLDKAVSWYHDHFGFEETKRFEKAELEIRGAQLKLGSGILEILEPRNPKDGAEPSARLPEALGAVGANHIAIGTPDLTACLHDLERGGARMISKIIDGRFFFCRDPFGTLIEVRQTN